MRFPRLFLRQVGWKRFLGLQVLLLFCLTQVLLAPLLWSLWLVPLGAAHPLQVYLNDTLITGIVALFLATEAVTMAIGVLGVLRARKVWLIPWVPTLHVYYPLATVAAYKALWELIFKPFYWDKTQHGVSN